MTFDELLALVSSNNAPGLCTDSRLVKAGDIFIAIEGTVYDGHDFIDEAIASGAEYIVCRKCEARYETRPERTCPEHSRGSRRIRDTRPVLSALVPSTVEGVEGYEVITVEDSARAAAILAQAGRGNPARRLTNLAVTGTNGKTTVAYLVRSIIQNAGERCGLLGTVVYDTAAESYESVLTTPDCLAIAEKQQQMLQAGSKYMVIEASSHALSQNRLAGIKFKAAAFTNLAGDHLDYHKTRENYLIAKTRLFKELSPDATAVLNRQSPQAEQIATETRAKILWYAIDEPADITAYIESTDITGTVFTLEYAAGAPKRILSCSGNPAQSSIVNRQSSIVKSSLLGRYNVSNHLAAAGLCLAAGFDLETIAAGLSSLQGVPGRLEKVEYSSHESRVTSHVLIDYAHTADALKNVLATLKPLCSGRLIVVFGCGGDRDRSKRPAMARVAEHLADFVIVTSDNPRTERPEDIISEIVAGFENREPRVTSHESRATKIIEPDRKRAIELAIKTAAKNDIVLIAGKGHESKQIIGEQKFDFNDKAVAQRALAKRK